MNVPWWHCVRAEKFEGKFKLFSHSKFVKIHKAWAPIGGRKFFCREEHASFCLHHSPRFVTTDFVHLHLHSHYSLLDGLGKVEQYVKKAKKLGMKAIALTDKGNVHGLIDLYKACQKEEIKPILGC